MSQAKQQKGVLLINLGTPDEPSPKAAKSYLKEFLMDPYVMDIPFLQRWILINLLIVPKRSIESAHAYQQIWTKRGSPLLYHTADLTAKLSEAIGPDLPVEFGMRYGNPSILAALAKLKARGVREIKVLPLYPQYSTAASESSIQATKKHAAKLGLECEFIKDFFQHDAYLEAVTEVSKPYFANDYDFVVMSYHGLPERHLRKLDKGGKHCLQSKSCCDAVSTVNRNCYKAQCYATSRALAKQLNIPSEKYVVAFQSRLGKDPWIKPYTDTYYQLLAEQGMKSVLVLCPSFVADCLETLEEIEMRGNEEFQQFGGEKLTLVPSLNSSEHWVKAVGKILNLQF